jgi:nitrite reductase/ring-hydroxylating ferredoxin subunit
MRYQLQNSSYPLFSRAIIATATRQGGPMKVSYTKQPSPPPSFGEARNLRQKARSAGMDPNHWYAVELSSKLPKGKAIEVVFWKRSIAVFRGEDGALGAMENRCAHRHLKLSEGVVDGCKLVCQYHGWAYSPEGEVLSIPHDTFGHKKPRFRVARVPVQERYGLVFIFPGDPERAESVALPRIPELEGDDPWPRTYVRLEGRGHFSMLLDNVSDFTHGFLHRKFQPFVGEELLSLRPEDDRVVLEYRSKIGAGPFQDVFIDRSKNDLSHMVAAYEYPYHWSNTGDLIKHMLFPLPIDEEHNRHIFVFYFSPEMFKLPGLGLRLPRRLTQPVMSLAGRLIMTPLLSQDVWAIDLEQQGWNAHWDKPVAELSPVVRAFQELTVRRWERYLAQEELVALSGASGSRS